MSNFVDVFADTITENPSTPSDFVDVFADTITGNPSTPSDFEALSPDEYDPLKIHEPEGIHGFVIVFDANDAPFYHLSLTKEQWDYHNSRSPKPNWVKSIKRMAKRFFKDTKAEDNSIYDGPRHVFGDSLYDVETEERIRPEKKNR